MPPESDESRLEWIYPRIATRLFSLEDDPLGDLTAGQIRVVRLLVDGPRSSNAIGEELRMSPSSVSQMLQRLQHLGIVELATSETDRRSKNVVLSERGQRLSAIRRERRIERIREALGHLSETQREQLLSSLETLFDACGRHLMETATPKSYDLP